MQIAAFVTCLNEMLFPEAGIATVRVLERLGHTVTFAEEQTCCGQMHFNAGYHDEALQLARRFAHVFADDEAIVAPSASCVSMIREFYPYLAAQSGDTALARRLDVLLPRVFELSQFLVDRCGVIDVGARLEGRVVYHPTCHSLRVLRVGDAPVRLLGAVSGLELVEVANQTECCGFGGTFAIKNADTSSAILGDKIAALAETGADVVTALDSSCLMHIGGGLARRSLPMRPMHLAEILAS